MSDLTLFLTVNAKAEKIFRIVLDRARIVLGLGDHRCPRRHENMIKELLEDLAMFSECFSL